MSVETVTYFGGPIFNGGELLNEHCAVFSDGHCSAIVPERDLERNDSAINLQGNILSPGYADLQVNGGGGVLFNDDPSVQTLETIATAHHSLGTRCLLPTLITANNDTTKAAIDAVVDAIKAGVSGIAGLHLEGPHLSIEKKGAHWANLIRPMLQEDLKLLLNAASKLPLLKITIAPENVSLKQVQELSDAGVLLALGHTNASYETCMAYHSAGVKCITHLFNAMSQFGSRDPGLVGACLTTGGIMAGLIADGIHVHPTTMNAALKSMGGPHRVYLVSDAMAVAGTSLQQFSLDGRTIVRQDNRLTLEDGTLAGADLEITHAIRFLVNEVGVELSDALTSAVTIPRGLIANSTEVFSLAGIALDDCITINANLSNVQAVA